MCRKLDKISQLNLMIKINLFPETSKNTKVKRKLIQFLAKLAVGLAQYPSGGSESPSTTGPIVPNSSLLSCQRSTTHYGTVWRKLHPNVRT